MQYFIKVSVILCYTYFFHIAFLYTRLHKDTHYGYVRRYSTSHHYGNPGGYIFLQQAGYMNVVDVFIKIYKQCVKTKAVYDLSTIQII